MPDPGSTGGSPADNGASAGRTVGDAPSARSQTQGEVSPDAGLAGSEGGTGKSADTRSGDTKGGKASDDMKGDSASKKAGTDSKAAADDSKAATGSVSDRDGKSAKGDGKSARVDREQIDKARTYFRQNKPSVKSVDRTEISVSIGAPLPSGIVLYDAPDVIVVSGGCPIKYFVWGDDVVLVDSCTREVVEIIVGVV